ncbi:MAG TPA: porphobilinogen synthase, partial [Devosiaceae bacterium]|nr:porphobilinogen synthase [Devosiaceae bacterium]
MTENGPTGPDMGFLAGRRPRRLRQAGWIRDLVRETVLTPHDLVWPVFIEEGINTRSKIATMPGVERLTIDLAVEAARQARAEGIPALVLFPNTPDGLRSDAAEEVYNPDNLMCRALSEIKSAVPGIGLIADTA